MMSTFIRAVLLLATAIAVIAIGGVQHAAASGTTMTVAYQSFDESFDPALSNDLTSRQIDYATCLMLVNYTDDPSPAGYELVPEAASALPTVSSNGLVYTFSVQPGFTFWDGTTANPVTADSFKRAIERTQQIPNAPGYADISDIANVQVVNGNQLQITLTHPDGALPAKLAQPHFCAVPVGTPASDSGNVPLPSAGPYYIDPSSVNAISGESSGVTDFSLLKNPHYTGSRPAGFDKIDLTITADNNDSYVAAQDPSPTVDYTSVPRAEWGNANSAFGPGSAAAAAGHQQFFTAPTNGLFYLVLNTSRTALVLKVRKAIARAINRTQIAADLDSGPATDDLVSPLTAGYVDENNFNLSGDVTAARALMAEAGYDAGHQLNLKLVTPSGTRPVAFGNDIVSELASIYINVTYVHSLFAGTYYASFLPDPNADWDMAYMGWIPDYSDFAGVIGPLLDGRTMTSTSVAFDFSHWNDAPTKSALDYANALPPDAARNAAFEQLATSLAKDSVPMAAVSQVAVHDFVSSRVGCVVLQPVYGLDLARLCPANPITAGSTYTQPGAVSQSNPVLVAVTPSADGSVSVVTASASSALSGYNVVGKQLIIDAPDAPDTSHPLSITLTIDAATLTAAGLNNNSVPDGNTVAVLRNGVPIQPCSPNDGTVSNGDDPCVTSRTTDGSGNAQITILTSHASLWSAGKPDSTPPTLNSVSLGSSSIAVTHSTTISVSAGADAVFAEFYVDTDAGAGENLPLGGTAGHFVSPPYGQLLSLGLHTIGVRVRDAAGNWSPVTVVHLHVVAAPLLAGTTICNGTYSGTGTDVVVPSGDTCTLVPGTHVKRSVAVRPRATLHINGVTLDGTLTIAGSATVCQSRIRVDVKLLFARGPLELGGPNCRGNTIGHDLLVTNANHNLWISGNKVANNLIVRNSHSATDSIRANKVGNLLVAHSGPVLVQGNRANNGDLRCVADNPLTGSGNIALGINTCPK